MTTPDMLQRNSTDTERRSDKTTAATLVYHELRRDILQGVLKPGQKLQIDTISTHYGVGANPVREALNRLSSERLVDREDQRGFFVPPLSLDHFRELVKTRCWLEPLALREAVANRTDAWEDQVVLTFHRLSRTPFQSANPTGHDNSEWEARHRAFHEALIAACGSSWMLKFCREIMDQVERYRYISMTSTYPRRDSNEEHRLIMEAALNGDAPLACDRLVAQYQLTLRLLEEQSDTVF
jgi:GntR family transcriptional regulator, carbon starvation induced regulator